MADSAAVTIPLDKIQKISIFINTPRRSLAQIKAETGADYLLNGTLYNRKTGEVNCHLKADGEVIAKPDYTVAGYAWNTGPDIAMESIPTAYSRNYIACTPLIVSGKPLAKLTYDAGQGGRRGRSAIGIKDGRLALYCTKDGTWADKTPEELRDELASYGWSSAVMLDGGGSSQCDFAGEKVASSRKVQHLILVHLKDEQAPETTPEEETTMSKKVCLDAGHDAGNKANKSPDGSFYEHEFVLNMAQRIGAILKDHGVEVIYTRKGGESVSLEDRCKIANAVKDLDLFVSLHSNAAAGKGWSSAKGWEAYVYALSGNRYKAAQAIESRVKKATSAMRSPAIRAYPELYVIKNTNAPAILIEHGFHTNKDDVAKMNTTAYRQALAEAEAYGILDYLGIPVKSKEKTEAEQAVEWITSQGIMRGSNGDLMLDQPPTRQQLAVMLYRFAKKYNL